MWVTRGNIVMDVTNHIHHTLLLKCKHLAEIWGKAPLVKLNKHKEESYILTEDMQYLIFKFLLPSLNMLLDLKSCPKTNLHFSKCQLHSHTNYVKDIYYRKTYFVNREIKCVSAKMHSSMFYFNCISAHYHGVFTILVPTPRNSRVENH